MFSLWIIHVTGFQPLFWSFDHFITCWVLIHNLVPFSHPKSFSMYICLSVITKYLEPSVNCFITNTNTTLPCQALGFVSLFDIFPMIQRCKQRLRETQRAPSPRLVSNSSRFQFLFSRFQPKKDPWLLEGEKHGPGERKDQSLIKGYHHHHMHYCSFLTLGTMPPA